MSTKTIDILMVTAAAIGLTLMAASTVVEVPFMGGVVFCGVASLLLVTRESRLRAEQDG